jgi:hypothetical protein
MAGVPGGMVAVPVGVGDYEIGTPPKFNLKKGRPHPDFG